MRTERAMSAEVHVPGCRAANGIAERVVAEGLLRVVPSRGHAIARHERVAGSRVGLVVDTASVASRVHVPQLRDDVVRVTRVVWVQAGHEASTMTFALAHPAVVVFRVRRTKTGDLPSMLVHTPLELREGHAHVVLLPAQTKANADAKVSGVTKLVSVVQVEAVENPVPKTNRNGLRAVRLVAVVLIQPWEKRRAEKTKRG